MCAAGELTPDAVARQAEFAATPGFRVLARSLWGRSELRGAALLAGAGLSRNAGLAAPDNPKPPLWNDLVRAMRGDLNLGEDDTLGALETAALYERTFRRGALEGLIRRLVPDASWEPGDLHTRLLRMPWSEVLTTNYDTLLERTADRITDPTYEIVLTPEDLARTRSPRIVKLHGTLPSHTPFVITQGDYGEYPSRFGPFVNLARQVLIENDVCLFGFSGDDPNFAAWTGWVRAEIGAYGRTLFLVGVLDLDDEARRAHLARGLMPIDLGPFVPDLTGDRDERNAAALELFVASLEGARATPPEAWPSDDPWPPTSDPPPEPVEPAGAWPGLHERGFAAAYVERCASRWREERLAYPGWIEPPPDVRDRLEPHVRGHMLALEQGLTQACLDDPIGTVADVLWRLDLLHGSLHTSDLAWIEPTLRAVDPMRLRTRDRAMFARLLLRTHREAEDRASFERWRDWFSPAAQRDGEVRALLAYEEALWSRDSLDFASLADRVAAVDGGDPAWALRRAMLFAELGRHDEMEAAELEAFRALQALTTRDRRSIWIRSRLGWAGFVANALTRTAGPQDRRAEFVAERVAEDAWLRRFDEGGCNPWRSIESLDDAISAAEEQAREDATDLEPTFDPGVVRRRGLTMRRMPTSTVDLYGIRLADHVGIPMALRERVNVLQSRIARAAALDPATERVNLARALAAASRGEKALVASRFNRLAVARLDPDVAADLFARVRRALDYALTLRPWNGYWVTRAATLVELLSRLVVRLPSEQATGCLQFALGLARHPNWRAPALFEPLGNLIGRSLDAIAPAERVDLALDLITFPLPSEVGLDVGIGWPEPCGHIRRGASRTSGDQRWLERVARLVAAVEGGDRVEASHASFRLLRLSHLGLLSVEERVSFGTAFWRRRGELVGPAQVGGIPLRMVCDVPVPDADERRSMIRRLVLAVASDLGPISIDGMLLLRRICEPGMEGLRAFLSDREILQVFEELAGWRPPPPVARDPGVFDAGSWHEPLGREIVLTLAAALLPALAPDELGEAGLAALRALITDPPASDRIALVPQATRLGALDADEAAARLQDALLGSERRGVIDALVAVTGWPSAEDLGGAPALPPQVVAEVAGLVSLRVPRALPQALRTARAILERGLVTPSDARRLTIGLEHLLTETDYGSWVGDDMESNRLTLIREEAARLAFAMARHGHASETTARWDAAASADALPEVRFANA